MHLKNLFLLAAVALLTAACGGADADFTDSAGGSGGSTGGSAPGSSVEPRQVLLVGPLLSGFEVVQTGGQVPPAFQLQVTDSNGMFSLHPSATQISVRVGKTVVIPNLLELSNLAAEQNRITTRGLLFGGFFRTGRHTVNGLRVLYAIDDDGNPSNGFQVSSGTRAAAANLEVDVSPLAIDFETDPSVVAALERLLLQTATPTRPPYVSASVIATVDASYLAELRSGLLKFKGSFAAAPGVLQDTVEFLPDGTVSFAQLGCTAGVLPYSVEYEEWASERRPATIARLDDRPSFLASTELSAEHRVACDSLGAPYVVKADLLARALESIDSEDVQRRTPADPQGDLLPEDIESVTFMANIEVYDPISKRTSRPEFIFSPRFD